MTVTKAQMRVLRLTSQDKTLIIGGIDGRKVRRDVVYRLVDMGLLKWRAPKSFYEESEWVLTDAGAECLRSTSTTARREESK